MDRTRNGSWGVLNIDADTVADTNNLILFDDLDRSYATDSIQSLTLEMPYADDGWLPRRVFVANHNLLDPASFTYYFESATAIRASLLAVAALAASCT